MAVIRETIERYENQTVEDLQLLPEGTLAELIDGEIVMSPSPTRVHQHISRILSVELEIYIRAHGTGVMYFAPIDVHLSRQYVFQPDIIYVSRERALDILGDVVRGAPDLVIEILSPSTGYYDLTKKRDAYERFGVKEYWIVDPERKRVEVLVLKDGTYRSDQTITTDGTARSVLLEGFAVDVAPLFDMPDYSRGK
jgi:Uma2 family endonuclease